MSLSSPGRTGSFYRNMPGCAGTASYVFCITKTLWFSVNPKTSLPVTPFPEGDWAKIFMPEDFIENLQSILFTEFKKFNGHAVVLLWPDQKF